MCGIIAYIGNKDAYPVLLEGLRRLEYRGYDSAGIAVACAGNAIKRLRVAGRVGELASLVQRNVPFGKTGIAHTRWATHGRPTESNAHPHADCQGEVMVVHNGIIENYSHLKEALVREGHTFSSETDSEVLSHLVERELRSKDVHSLEEAVANTLHRIRGTFGIAVIFAKEPEKIVIAKKGSPVLLGIGDGAFFAASDGAALVQHTRSIVYLGDEELAILRPDGYEVRNMWHMRVAKPIEILEGTVEDAEKGGFSHFMAKEINEIPEVIRNALRGRILFKEGTAKVSALDDLDIRMQSIDRILLTACGTSYYAGLAGKYMIEECSGLPVEVWYASELRYASHTLTPRTLVVAVSQSGETADTLEALREAKRKNAPTLAIVNVVGSSIAREAGAGIYNHAGPEISVASTKAFVSQLAILALFAVWAGRKRNLSLARGQDILREIQQLPRKVEHIFHSIPMIKTVAQTYANNNNFLYVGRKYSWPVALEGALKLKEITYAHAEGYAAGELKHGPLALVTDSFPCVAIALSDSVYEKSISNIQEIKARGGTVIAIASEGDTTISSHANDVLFIPRTLEMLSPLLAVVPLHLFAYYMACERGRDVDKPRNLAKSVTVE